MTDRQIRILAVDDNPDNLITVKALIQEAFPDAAVLTALSGGRGMRSPFRRTRT
jgi:response regulator RpfG family c-di-GMP phosphodiesterase